MSVLITGAAGNIGALVTKRLLKRGERPCVFVRDAKKARELFGDRVDVRVGDPLGSSLVITGPEALSYGEMASKLGAVVLVDIWRAIRAGRLATVTDGVECIIGRQPIPFDRWAEENAAAFR